MNCIKNGIKIEGASCSLNNNCIYPKCMKPTKQTVYLPVNGDYLTAVCTFENNWVHQETVQPQEGYFFTPEQLNQLLSDVIKQALNTAAEKVQTTFIEDACPLTGEEFETKIVDRQSITNTFEETFKKFEV